jgi:Family of unknown function (DUF6492)
MRDFVLYCKSYRTDVRRVVRLAESVQRFNVESIPFHISVPHADLSLFTAMLAGLNVVFHADEDILKTVPGVSEAQVKLLPGSISQQVIKASFWRMGISTCYLCLDSDAFFIRPFGTGDFLTSDGLPYTMLDEAHDLLEDAMRHKKQRIVDAFKNESQIVQRILNRQGRQYNFGPFPLVWHRAVWESLDQQYLQPNGMSFADAIVLAPIESRWYGESLLRFEAIALRPCQSLFKVYHYAWQRDQDLKAGVDLPTIAQLYCGVIFQSAWERELDWPTEGGSWLSRIGRRIRRTLGRI